MTTQNIIQNEKLRKFLINNNAFENFVRNVTKRKFIIGMPITENVGVISTAFNWANTPEGEEYWHDLHVKHIHKFGI